MNYKIRRAMTPITEQFAGIEAELSRLPVPGDPTILSMTMREFIREEVLGKKRIKNFGYTWTNGEPVVEGQKISALSHYKTVGEMPVCLFIQYHTAESMMSYRNVGQTAVKKLSTAFADFGIIWPHR